MKVVGSLLVGPPWKNSSPPGLPGQFQPHEHESRDHGRS
jgi:hypothetical protein